MRREPIPYSHFPLPDHPLWELSVCVIIPLNGCSPHIHLETIKHVCYFFELKARVLDVHENEIPFLYK